MDRSIALALLFAFVALACSSDLDNFRVEQYVVSGKYDGVNWDLAKDPRRLVFKTGTLQTLNCTIVPPNDAPYEYVAIHYLPGVPATLGSSFDASYAPADALNGVPEKPKRAKGQQNLSWSVQAGDPNGIYKIEIVVDGELIATLEFEVIGVPPAA